MRNRPRHILITLLVGAGLTLGVTTLLATSSHTGPTAGAGDLCVVPDGGPNGPFPACDQVFTSVQEAVDGAVAGQEVRVASGVYTDVHTRDGVTQIVYISRSISIQGGYTPPFDASPDPLARPTTLDAQGLGRVIYITGDISATLTGLRITGGDATGLDAPDWAAGGGVYAISATVTISSSVIYSNTASTDINGSGGGLAFSDSNVTLMANTVQENVGSSSWSGAGGGVTIWDSVFHITNNRILSNTAVVTSAFIGYGGGVAIVDSSGQLINNRVDGNITAGEGGIGFGGGIFIGAFEPGREDSVIIQDNKVQNNVAGLDDGDGGGVHIMADWDTSLDARLLANVIQNNVAAVNDGVGGGFWMAARPNSTATLTLRHNHVLSNTASIAARHGGLGGGIAIGGVTVDSEGNHIVGNTAGTASAIYFEADQISQQADILSGNVITGSDGYMSSGIVYDASRATASNLVVVDNEGSPDGAAITVRSSAVRLTHSTLARNSGGSGISVETCPYSSCSPSTAALTNTILVSHSVGVRITDGNTVTLNGVLWYQAPIALSKGPAAVVTITHQVIGDPSFAADGYHLTAGSAAIGRGVPTKLQVDIDHEARPLAPALGADEYWADKAYLPLILRQ